MSFGTIAVGIPPAHRPGQVEVADDAPDPARHFHQRGIVLHGSERDMLRAAANNQGSLLVFVHGYNNTFTESLFRFAQIIHDADQQSGAIAFQWASLGDPRAYLHDRDSALLAREALSELLVAAAEETKVPIRLAAHSMGSLVVLEALRRLSHEGQRGALERISEIVLISPDVDITLFQTQLAQIDLDSGTFAVVVNREDRLLGVASRIAGGQERAGAAPSPNDLRQLGVRVFDVTGATGGDRPGHFLPATSPELLSIIRSLPNRS